MRRNPGWVAMKVQTFIVRGDVPTTWPLGYGPVGQRQLLTAPRAMFQFVRRQASVGSAPREPPEASIFTCRVKGLPSTASGHIIISVFLG